MGQSRTRTVCLLLHLVWFRCSSSRAEMRCFDFKKHLS